MKKQKYGPWALITGAAMGLGAEFAKQIAQQGISIVGVDIAAERLDKTLEAICQEYGVQTKAIVLDVSRDDFLEKLLEQLGDISIGLLVNNAGISNIGYFCEQEAKFLQKQLKINTEAVLLLTHHFAQQMTANAQGGIIIVSSGAGQLSSAYNASYSATKAYDLMLAESLWAELKPKGVDVLGFMPGPTKTPGYIGQGGDGDGALVMSAAQSVQQALANLGKRPSFYAGSFVMRQAHRLITRLLSTKLRIKIVSSQIRLLFNISEQK